MVASSACCTTFCTHPAAVFQCFSPVGLCGLDLCIGRAIILKGNTITEISGTQ